MDDLELELTTFGGHSILMKEGVLTSPPNPEGF